MQFVTTVFLPASPPEQAPAALTAALAPFDANDYQREPYDPRATWDRWNLVPAGALPLRPAHAEGAGAVFLQPEDGDPVPVIAPLAAVDFDAMRAEARQYAAGTWDAWAEVSRAHPGALPRAHFDRLHADSGAAQGAYLLQPAVQTVAQAAATQRHPYFSFNLLLADPVTLLGGDREAYVDQAGDQALATYAYVTLEGDWCTEYTAERGWAAHARALAAYLDAAPPDALIARVRCHA
ncbi:hypothetical protein [Hamadaea tsunoensis]|uniref:hypothetical protein n=1 Tax=Hamadaea tsunoensis TaxID=53368 RepID=UPI00040553E2|nr:hypothetical protein [Hamadaea tsunoensis]